MANILLSHLHSFIAKLDAISKLNFSLGVEALQRNLNQRVQSLEAVVTGWDEEASDDLSPSVPCPGAPNEVDNCLFLHYIG